MIKGWQQRSYRHREVEGWREERAGASVPGVLRAVLLHWYSELIVC